MGRSSASSCLRIIACAGGHDDAESKAIAVEKNSSGDKRGWSFRKKSGKQRGLITSVVSETTTPASRTREALESTFLKSPSLNNNNVSEKQQQPFLVDEKKNRSQSPVDESANEKNAQSAEDKTEFSVEEQIDYKTDVPVLVESKGTETEEDGLTVVKPQGLNASDADAIEKGVIPDVENASKVERVESETDDVMIIIRKENDEEVDESIIVIIQAAIRGFLARRDLLRRKKVIKLQAAVRGHLVRSQAMGSLRCVQAIVKMQAMVRARHSMKDGSRVSTILDKAEVNAATHKLLENKFAKHLMESAPKTKSISIKCDPSPTKPSSAWNWLDRWMSVPKPEKTSKADLTTKELQLEETRNVQISPQVDFVNSESTVETKTESDWLSFEASKRATHHVELSETEKMRQYDSPEASAEVSQNSIQSHPLATKELYSLHEEPEYVDGEAKHSLKRKASNPSFVAAQSKFEELTSSTGSNRAMTLSSKDAVLGEEGKTDIDSPDITNTRKDHSLEDVTLIELSGSKCGTELSVTSSLDTLEEKSDADGAEHDVEANLLENKTFKTDQEELIEIDVKDKTSLGTVENAKKKLENAKDKFEVSARQHESVISTPDFKKRLAEDESEPQAYSLSEVTLTPMTITESQATPASQASSSVKARKGKSEKSGSSQKRKVSKKITSSPKKEIGTGEATEQEEGKEQKSGRRNSFGVDQEAREGSGGKNSLPRFMQPTQSAKAKVQEHNSPRSSPDLQERDAVPVKKRHSLPGDTNGKQGSSPRVLRSAPQAQQGTKDRKWQR